ncbi:MAG TPA: (2Fe-2S)-binding protein [Gemmatimonadales bacterium]|jgi:isoquinoline 1-oxidoreductase alpha subunit|nr:(2Fe-2S)-binding protein [Gemmatimonadales bacterium]
MKLIVNGTTHDVAAPPAMPLLWALRDLIGLTGTKFGCGQAFCGACTVLVDGAPTRSCSVPVGAVENRLVTTIEGLVRNGKDHPVQQAWLELNVPQCGYCQAGQLLSAAALLERKPRPSDADIDTAMAGNLCRCGTYLRIRQAIKRAADIKDGRVTP